MSSEPLHLKDWISALYDALDQFEPHNARAIRGIAGKLRARIALDKEAVSVGFRGPVLDIRILKRSAPLAAPSGMTSRACVTSILFGYLGVSEAVAQGQLELRGSATEVINIAAIIEILVDASTRIPPMQKLADQYLALGPTGDLRAEYLARRAAKTALLAHERAFLERAGLLE